MMTMYCTTRRLPLSLLTMVVLAALLAPLSAAAQGESAEQVWFARVQEKELAVRSGAGTNYYSFGSLKEGDIVTVIGELYGFARLATKDRAFAKFHGLVPAENVQLGADGKTATTLGRTVISAPNLDREGMPSQSWQRLVRLDVGQKLSVVGKLEEAGKTYYKVVLPDDADGWVPMRALVRATPEEAKAYNAKPIEPTKPAETKPAPPQQGGNATNDTGNRTSPPANQAADNNNTGREETATPPTTPLRKPEETAVNEGAAGQNADDATEATTPPTTPPGGNADGAPTETVTPPARPAKPASVERFESLEKSYEALTKEPVCTAEISPLLTEYRNLAADESADERVRAMCDSRIAMLEVRQDLQTRLREIDKLRARADLTKEEAAAARLALDRSGDYDAVGRLTASTVYTGATLPRLLRIVDPATGRTIAYIEPDDRFDYAGMIGQIVGVTGSKSYDAGLRLTLVKPRHVEILTASVSATASERGGN